MTQQSLEGIPELSAHERALLVKMARGFYGYGSFKAPYWFIGPEPAGPEQIKGKLHSWETLGCAPVVSNREHHRGFSFYEWHPDVATDSSPRLQKTWLILMIVYLAFKGEYLDKATATRRMRSLQAFEFGCTGSDTALLEIGGLPATGLAERYWPYGDAGIRSLTNRTAYENTFYSRRIKRLRGEIEVTRPTFVWLYGPTGALLPYWEQIAGGDLHSEWTGAISCFLRRDPNLRTVFVATAHATAHGVTHQDWIEFGKWLRRAVDGFSK